MFNNLKIVGNRVFLDDFELKGVTNFKFEKAYNDVSRLSIEMIVDKHEINVMEEKEDGK